MTGPEVARLARQLRDMQRQIDDLSVVAFVCLCSVVVLVLLCAVLAREVFFA